MRNMSENGGKIKGVKAMSTASSLLSTPTVPKIPISKHVCVLFISYIYCLLEDAVSRIMNLKVFPIYYFNKLFDVFLVLETVTININHHDYDLYIKK